MFLKDSFLEYNYLITSQHNNLFCILSFDLIIFLHAFLLLVLYQESNADGAVYYLHLEENRALYRTFLSIILKDSNIYY